MATTLKERRPVRNAEAIAERPDGTRVSFVPYPSPLLDADGNFIGAMNLLVDITDRKLAEQALESAVQKQDEVLALNLETEARLMMLVQASSRLIESLSPEDTLPAILGVARKVLTADAFAVWSPDATGEWRVLTAEGLSSDYLTEHGTATWGDAAPTLVVEDVALEPVLADRLGGYEREGIRSLLVVPLAFAGRPAGTLTFYYRQRHMFAEAEVRVATALASLAAAAIGHAEMRELERSSRELTQQLNHRLAFLLNASAQLSASLDVDEILERIAHLSVPELADWCVVTMIDDGEARTAAIAHKDPGKVEFARALSLQQPRPVATAPAAHGWARVLRTREPELIEEVTDAVLREAGLDEDRLAIAPNLNIRSSLVVPLIGRDRVLGAVSLIAADEHPPFTPADIPFAEEVARRAVVAIENARLYSESETTAELLRVANAAKDEFLSLVSHELKTPLTTIRGNAGVLYRSGDRIDTASRQAALADMVNEGERLYRIIENLLLLARAEQGQLTDIEPLLLIRMVERVIERHRQRNIGRRYEVVERGDTQPVLFSEACLEQVLENLISNAEKYSPVSERIVVEIDRKPKEVTLRVLDRGVGISVSEAAEIFEPFFRAKHASDHAEGLGIGLAVCKRLVEAQGGHIWAEPRDAGGSEFGFMLPVADEDLDV